MCKKEEYREKSVEGEYVEGSVWRESMFEEVCKGGVWGGMCESAYMGVSHFLALRLMQILQRDNSDYQV